MTKFFLMLLEDRNMKSYETFTEKYYTSSGKYFEIRRPINGFRRIVFTDGRSLLIKYIKFEIGSMILSYRGSRLSIDAIKIRKSPLYFGGIGLNDPLKNKQIFSFFDKIKFFSYRTILIINPFILSASNYKQKFSYFKTILSFVIQRVLE